MGQTPGSGVAGKTDARKLRAAVAIPNQDLREVSDELWNEDGVWQGPRDLRFFLRTNWYVAAFWWMVLTFITIGIIFGEAEIPGLYAIPLGILAGAAATLFFMFLFSRGWIAEGD
jgi:hypothetical protein